MTGSKLHQNRRGFTLIELMVVLMLIGILASLAVARFMSANDKGRIAAATCDLDLVRKLLGYYDVDWNSYPPSAASYWDLQDLLVDADGNMLGELPYPYTFDFISYSLDANRNYVIRVRARDNGGTILVATPLTIIRE